jgi:hypothetical protein
MYPELSPEDVETVSREINGFPAARPG